MDDTIYRQAAKKAVEDYLLSIDISEVYPSITGAMKRVITELPSAQPETEERTAESAQNVQNGELISKKAAIDALKRAEALTRAFGYHCVIDTIQELPSAQPEITNEAAVEYLQSTGWMQQHEREIYEMGLKARLADDSDSYDALAEPHIGGGEQDERVD